MKILSLFTVIRHEIRIIQRQAFSWVTPLLFFVIVVTLFPLAVGADEAVLRTLAPGIIWVAALLAILLSISNLFRQDAENGYLDLLLVSHYPLTLLVMCKVMTHWLTHCLPLILISPLLGFLLHLHPQEIATLMGTLCLGTPILCLLGAIGAGLMVGIRNSGLLLPILILPLYIPVLIFATGTIVASTHHQATSGYFAILMALMLFSLAFAPLLTSVALRIGVNQ